MTAVPHPSHPAGVRALVSIDPAVRRQAHLDLLDLPVITLAEHPESFRRVDGALGELRTWFAEHTGWHIDRRPQAIRLVRTPAAATMDDGLPWARSVLDYELLCWVLWYRETVPDAQFTLAQLRSALEEQIASLLRMGRAGGDEVDTVTGARPRRGTEPQPHFSWDVTEHRRSLQRVMEALQDYGAVEMIDREPHAFLEHRGDVLYEFTDVARQLYTRETSDDVTAASGLVAEAAPLGGRWTIAMARPSARHRLWRTLLLTPALTPDVDAEAFALLGDAAERRAVETALQDRFGWDLEWTGVYAAVLRPARDEAQRPLFPTHGVHNDIAILVATAVRERLAIADVLPAGWQWRRDGVMNDALRELPVDLTPDRFDRVRLTRADVERLLLALRGQFGRFWSKAASEGTIDVLVADVTTKMRQYGLLSGPDVDDAFYLSPVAARFEGVYLQGAAPQAWGIDEGACDKGSDGESEGEREGASTE